MNSGDIRDTVHPSDANRQAVGVVGTVTVTPGPGAGAVSDVNRVAVSVVNVTLLAAKAARLGATIFNNSTSTLFLKLGATANIGAGTESFTVSLNDGDYYEVPFGYTAIRTAPVCCECHD